MSRAIIAPGAVLRLKGRVLFRNVEVAGELQANLACSGVLTVRASGHFRGALQGAHLVVEEGGGLNGRFQVEPDAVPAPAPKRRVGGTP